MNLYKKLIAAAAMILTMTAAHATQTADSVTVIKNPAKVVITNSADGHTKVEVFESDHSSDTDIMFGKNNPTRLSLGKRGHVLFFNGIFGGMVFPTDEPKGMLPSWEIGVTHLLGYGYRTGRYTPELSAGIGFAYRWYNVGNGYRIDRQADRMELIPVNTGEAIYKSPNSRFTTSSFLLSFSLKQKIYRKLYFMASAILDFNFYTDAFFEYKDHETGSVKTKINYKGFHQRIMRCDLMATIGFSGIAGVYVRYLPTPVFKDSYGPKFEQIAAGISLFF